MRLSRQSLKTIVAVLAGLVPSIGQFAVPTVAARSTTTITLDTTLPDNEITAPPGGWSFRNHVIPVLTKLGCNSGACHGAAAGKNGFKLTLRGYDPDVDFAVLTRQAGGRRVNQVEPARSLMLLKPTMAIGHGGGKRMEVGSLEYRVIAEWIASGLHAPSEADPLITKLEVTPAAATLATGAETQLRVMAHYSDGHAEDVTRWVKYATADSSVASVDDNGKVKVQGNGEAAITVWYQSRVSFSRITDPFTSRIDSAAFARAARNNYIDDLILKKLENLRIPPSEGISENEFIRRAFLDATGTLPTPVEVEAFIGDKAPGKRARLIDSLLERKEYVDYWTNRWSDVLLVSSAKLQSNAMWTFHDWIRASVASNKPWNQFVREVVTASGNTLENGAAHYYVIHKEPTDLNENVSMAFLGMSITCARCHNHPLEKWTQKQYYEMANLFSRVGLKNGMRGGDVQVYSNPSGEINHPRLGKPLPPRPLDGEALQLDSDKDRREYLADWLTSPKNPYFARALVNRVWKNFFGRGLVEAVDDMRATNPPSNEELLAAMTKDFVDHGFDVKYLVRTVMNSAAYQRSSRTSESNQQDDRYYSHYILRRLPAEALLDAVSQVTGVATQFTGYPAGMRAMEVPDARVTSYFLKAFGKPPRVMTCECERSSEPSVTQALHIINGETINQKLRARGGLVDNFVRLGMSNRMIVNHLYLAAFSRAPSEDELKSLEATLSPNQQSGELPMDARRQQIEDLVWAVLTSKEFMFNH